MVYVSEANQQIHNHRQLVIPQNDICLPSWNYYWRFANIEKAQHEFQVLRLQPFIPDVYSDEGFLPLQVTNCCQRKLNDNTISETKKMEMQKVL
jgi:hypothetical protein